MSRLHQFLQVNAGDLMSQRQFAPLLRGLQHGQADLERGFAPATVQERRPVFLDRFLQRFELGGAALVLGAGNLLLAVLGIDEEAVRRLPDDAVLASDDRDAEKGLGRAFPSRPFLGRPRMGVFVFHIDGAFEPLAGHMLAETVLRQPFAAFADAPGQLGDVEKAVAVKDAGGGAAVFEFQESREVAFGIEILVVAPSDGPHALHHAAADVADDVDHMRALAKDDAAADAGIDLGGEARALQPVVGVPAVDLDDFAEPAAGHNLPDFLDGGPINFRVALYQLDAVRVGRLDHAIDFFQCHCRGLLHDDMNAALRRGNRVLRVADIGRRDPNSVDLAAVIHGFDAVESLAGILLLEFLDRIRPRVRPCRKTHAGDAVDMRQDLFRSRPEPGDSDSQCRTHSAAWRTNPIRSLMTGISMILFFAGSRMTPMGSPPLCTTSICSRSILRNMTMPRSAWPRC